MSHATLNSGDKNMSLYEGMAHLYKDMMDYNMVDVIDQSQMIGFGVDDDAAIDFDQLNPLEFKECLDFILAHYREAHNNKNKSGNHQPFADYTSGKPYLLYLHLWSTEIGDKAFSDCVYSTLPSETSSAMIKLCKVVQVAIFLTMLCKLPLITFFNILNLFVNRPNAISILIQTCDK